MGKVVTEGKFLKEVREYFGVEADYIKAVLKAIVEGGLSTEDLIVNEHFNKGVIEGMKKASRELELFFQQNVKQPVQDFKEIDPDATVIDTVQEKPVEEISDIVITDSITDSSGSL